MIKASFLRRFSSAFLFVTLFAFAQANARDTNGSCLGDLSSPGGTPSALEDWDDLPPVTEGPLSSDLRNQIDAHPLAASLRARFGAGKGLHFHSNLLQAHGGWLIQKTLLRKMIQHLFPKANISDSVQENSVTLKLHDSTMRDKTQPNQFDMVDLKILNAGPALPDRARVRALLDLPAEARIASVYDAIKRSLNSWELVRSLFDQDLVDIIVLSSQTAGARHMKFGWHDKVPLFTSEQWIDLRPAERPSRAIIFNDTRNRLPYMHAAADFVVVTGEANFFEGIHAGRPTYFDKWGGRNSTVAWQRIGAVAERSGFGFALDGAADLVAHRSRFPKAAPATADAPGSGSVSAEDQRLALTNILQALTELTGPVAGENKN